MILSQVRNTSAQMIVFTALYLGRSASFVDSLITETSAQLYAALRWNQQLFGTVPDDNKQVQWGNDVWRVDAALGYRFTNYLQGKLQYSFTHVRGDASIGEQLLAAQLTLKF